MLRKLLSFLLVAVVCGQLTATTSAANEETDPAEEQEVRAAIVACAANLQSFTFYRARFTLTSGEAASSGDALARRWTNASTGKARYLLNDPYQCYEVEGISKVPGADKKDGATVTKVPGGFVTTVRGITSGKYLGGVPGGLGYSPQLTTINLFPTAGATTGFHGSTPLDMRILGHRGSRAPDRLQANTADFQTTYLGRKTIDGLPLLGVRFVKPAAKEAFEFWLDPARGFLPARCIGTNKSGTVLTTYLQEVRECSNGRWFPLRSLTVRQPAAAGVTVGIYEMHVTELDTDNRPDLSEFTIDVPDGTTVTWFDPPTPSYKLRRDEKINVLDLPEVFKRLETARTNPYQDTIVTHQRGSWWPWIGAMGGLLVLLLGAVLYLRRARPRSRQAGFSLLELLVVLAILAVVLGMILPVVQAARESAARAHCANNLRQIGLALHGYHGTQHGFPPGLAAGDQPYLYLSWLTRLTPYLEHEAVWRQTQLDYARLPLFWGPPRHTNLGRPMPQFVCPSDGRVTGLVREQGGYEVAFTHYLGVSHSSSSYSPDGVLYRNSRIRFADVTDGTANTVAVGERPPSSPDGRWGWWYAGVGQEGTGEADMVLAAVGSRFTYRVPTCPPGPYYFGPGSPDNICDIFHFWSRHRGPGAHFLFVDGGVRFLPYSARDILQQLASRNGGEAVLLPD